jgi:hypothetical protein
VAKRKVVEETVQEETTEALPVPYPCPWCGGDGLKLKGWDEDGNEINETCLECGGTGILEGA